MTSIDTQNENIVDVIPLNESVFENTTELRIITQPELA